MTKREPLIRTDKRQLPLALGDAGPAIQLQAAKDARGGIGPRGAVKACNEGLFAPRDVKRGPELFDG